MKINKIKKWLKEKYDVEDLTWEDKLVSENFSLNSINELLREQDVNLVFCEDRDGYGAEYVVAKTFVSIANKISGWLEFDSDCYIDKHSDTRDFIEDLANYITQIEVIHSKMV
jgi:hypothetical protein